MARSQMHAPNRLQNSSTFNACETGKQKNNKWISHGTIIKNRLWLGGGIWRRRFCLCLLLLLWCSIALQCHVASTSLGVSGFLPWSSRAGNLFYLSACHVAWGGMGGVWAQCHVAPKRITLGSGSTKTLQNNLKRTHNHFPKEIWN